MGFWLGITIFVLIIFVLTWFGAKMTRSGLPNGWEGGRRNRRGDRGAPIYGPNDHDPYN